jgi:pSer/pThr/pTyr-binding forkhead associated (FHA) protein
MKSGLDLIEARLQAFIEGSIQFLPLGNLQQMLANRLAFALQESISQNTGGTFSAPSMYTIYLKPQNLHLWKNKPELLKRLAGVLSDAAHEQDVHFLITPLIHLDEDASLPIDDLKIIVQDQPTTSGGTVAVHIDVYENYPSPPPNAFLILNGAETFILDKPVINIGRRPNNQLVIDDPRVSRSHAQIRVKRGGYLIADLNSTGGTFVNGQRITQQILKPGDVISLAGIPIIFGEETPSHPGKTGKIYRNPDENSKVG